MKMIGVARLRSRERTSRAVSKPSMPGIATSRMISAKSCSSRRAERLDPGVREHELAAERRERGFDRDQVGLVVVDDEDVAAVADRRAGLLFFELEREIRRGGRWHE